MLIRSKQTREREKKVRAATQDLWHDLCLAHDLKRWEIRALKQITRDLRYDEPALLFFLPEAFKKYIIRNRDHLGRKARQRLEDLASRLFTEGGLQTPAEKSPVGQDGLPHSFTPDELDSINSAATPSS